MTGFCSMFSQLLKLFPRLEFQKLVKETKAERHARGFSCWDQLVAMLFCQLGRAHSLREISGGLARCEGKLSHLGISAPARSTLAYANEHRPWQLYESVFHELPGRCQSLARGHRKFRFKNKLVSLDSTVIDLCMSLFDWAKFKRTKGAIKLHLLLDHDGCLPSMAVVTDGKTSNPDRSWPEFPARDHPGTGPRVRRLFLVRPAHPPRRLLRDAPQGQHSLRMVAARPVQNGHPEDQGALGDGDFPRPTAPGTPTRLGPAGLRTAPRSSPRRCRWQGSASVSPS